MEIYFVCNIARRCNENIWLNAHCQFTVFLSMKAVGVPAGGLRSELAFHYWNFSSQNDKLDHNSIRNQAWLMADDSKPSQDMKSNIVRNNYFNYNKDTKQTKANYCTISKPSLQREEKWSTTNQMNNWIRYLQSENERSGVWIMALFDDVQSCRLLQLPYVCVITLYSSQ